MAEEDIEKTAVCTPFGSFDYLRIPFGLRNSSSSFQFMDFIRFVYFVRFMDSILSDLPFVVSYIDDLLIFSENPSHHDEHLQKVFERLVSHGLRVNPGKCKFHQNSMEFLGFLIQASGIKPIPGKVEDLRNLPPPTDAKTLRSQLGMFSFYQRFIPNFSALVIPLRDVLKRGTFQWSAKDDEQFNCLKKALANSAELDYPREGATISITTDASSVAIGGCLHQTYNGNTTPLAFFSRKLSDTESRYSTFDRELLAIFAAIKKWKDLIHGRPTTVFTDHRPIVGAFHSHIPRFSDRQQRQLSAITEYVSDILYIAGKDNVVADALSRPNTPPCVANVVNKDDFDTIPPIDLPAIARAQISMDIDASAYKEYDIGIEQKLLCENSQTNPRPVIPDSLRKAIFSSLHALAHPGFKATFRLLNTRYFWPGMKADVQQWCAQCERCQSCKISRHVKKPIKELPQPSQRFTTVHLDIVGPLELPEIDAFERRPRYLLTMIDSYSRWFEAAPLSDISAINVAKTFLSYWIARFGPPLTLVTDRGSQFRSELMQSFTNLLGIHHIRTSAYNPRANGKVERMHRTMKAALRARGKYWVDQLPIVLFGLRIATDENNNSPFSILTGEQPLVPPITVDDADQKLLSEKMHNLFHPYRLPREHKATSFLPAALKTCEFAWLRLDRVRSPLEAPYQGPYKVLHKTDDTFILEIKSRPVVVSIDRVKPANVSIPSAATQEQQGTPPQETMTNDTSFSSRTRRKVSFNPDPSFHYY